MIVNVFGKFWGNDELIQLRDNLPQGFGLKLYTLYHKCVQGKDIQFNERMADSITITCGDQFYNISLESGTDISYVSERLSQFVKENTPSKAQPENIDELRASTVEAVKKILNINNDVIFYDNQKMSFELNLYTAQERKKILALLSTVDRFVPEIFVDITLNNATVEQLNALNDRLMEAELVVE